MTGMPGRRKVIPKPFSRPSITVSETVREWQYVKLGTLAVGDIIAGEGRVNSHAVAGEYVSITLGEDPHTRLSPASMVVHAFTRIREPASGGG